MGPCVASFITFAVGATVVGARVMISKANAGESWKADEALDGKLSAHCDIPVVDGLNALRVVQSSYPNTPVLFKNLTESWLAHDFWHKDALISAFGDRIIRVGSESSIVYSAGHAEVNSRLGDFLLNLSSGSPAFVFDTTILSVIPELNQHFHVSALFSDWDSPSKEQSREMWHMLSVGPSGAGLPFHNHGKTWLAVVHGRKQWFLYPPGFGPPREADAIFNALHSSSDWLSKVYPLIETLTDTKAPLSSPTRESIAAPRGFRPLECSQARGDVMFLPSMWSHMTLNVGETIAVGGQQYLSEEERLRIASLSYQRHSSSYETLKDLALGGYHSALRHNEALRRRSASCGEQMAGISCLASTEQLRLWAVESMDSLVVLFYERHGIAEDHLSFLMREFHALARLLTDATIDIDFIVVPILSVATIPNLQGGSMDIVWSVEAETRAALVMYEGWLQADLDHNLALLDEGKYREPRHSFTGPELAQFCEESCGGAWKSLVSTWIEANRPAMGSVQSGRTVQSRASALQGIKLLKSAMNVRPLHPEVLLFLSDMGDHAGMEGFDEVGAALLNAELTYDRYLVLLSVPRWTFASLYHKLAGAHEKIGNSPAALRLLEKSLEVVSDFQPALRDRVRMLTESGYKEDGRAALRQMVDQLHSSHLWSDLGNEVDELAKMLA